MKLFCSFIIWQWHFNHNRKCRKHTEFYKPSFFKHTYVIINCFFYLNIETNFFRLQVDGWQKSLRGRERVQRGCRSLLSGVRQHGGVLLLQVRPEVLRTRAGRQDLQEEGQHSALSYLHQQGMLEHYYDNNLSCKFKEHYH